MNTKTKILLAIRQGQVGGGETHVYELAKNLNKQHFDVEVLSFTNGLMINKLNDIGITTHVIHSTKPFDIKVWKKVTQLIKTNKYDIIHAHGTKLRLPLIYTIHGWSFHQSQSKLTSIVREMSENFITHMSNLNIAVSENNKNEGKLNFGLNNIKVIYNGIDLNKFNPKSKHNDIRKEFNVKPNETLLGYMVRLTEQKDPITMIKAMQQVYKVNKGIKLLIVGNGNLEATIKKMVNESEIKNNVIFSNFREDIPAVLNAIDIYCLPSLWEGMPIGLIEAMAMGKTTISTSVDGTKELITNNYNGFNIPVNDPLQLANTILKIHNNSKIKMIIGENARKTINEHFNITNMVHKIEDVYFQFMTANKNYLVNHIL
jgi:glycosyltransferase involved in cell wall biosynthesis